MDFLIKHKLINPSQHGFLKARSWLTNLLCFFEEITIWVDEGLPVDVIYLYFQKAFDKVPHQRLILKLKPHGMGSSIINWIKQWLTDRKQRVVVEGEVSSWKSVLSGVPQGSVVGPILFLVYMNDLEEGLTGSILKFADDTKLFRKTKEIGDKQNLQDDDKLVKWSEKWQMLFNLYIKLRRSRDCICVSVATVSVATVSVATVSVATVSVATVSVATVSVATVWRRCGFSDASVCVTVLLHLLILGKCYAVHINASSL